jgi:hypothetical protein
MGLSPVVSHRPKYRNDVLGSDEYLESIARRESGGEGGLDRKSENMYVNDTPVVFCNE